MIILTLLAFTSVALLYGSVRLTALALSLLAVYAFPLAALGVLGAAVLAVFAANYLSNRSGANNDE